VLFEVFVGHCEGGARGGGGGGERLSAFIVGILCDADYIIDKILGC
jgi:hypothetical protein